MGQTNHIDPNTFTPFPKNPLLVNFFINIGRADLLGSGVRNLYKYTKIYSGGEPELVEGDVFRATVPLSLTVVSDNTKVSDKMSDNGFLGGKNPRNALLTYLRDNGEVTAAEAAKILDRSVQTARRVLSGLVAEGAVIASGANRNRKYRAK
ncbi:MAG: DeoR family transcriptional regulator [Acidaminococcales bacterium]|jgi:ATP-dependent DNA helicase RecG|nr:DeoR family transcriptional regulator [Acidaminococcales bacterium]